MDRRLSFPSHRRLLIATVLTVVAGHLGLGQWLARSVIGAGAADGPPPAIEVAFVRELALAAPPAAARPLAKPLPAQAVAAPKPNVVDAMALPTPDLLAPDSLLQVPQEPEPPETEPPVYGDEVPPMPLLPPPVSALDWPPATRLLYVLNGHYRGPLYGSGQVDWLRDDTHYQVRVTVDVDPAFTRRLVSDGDITAAGLVPQRYDEETDIPLLPMRRHTVRIEGRQIELSSGVKTLAPDGVQDSASQFVQLTWLFLTDPTRLAVGKSVSLPLALPRRVGDWIYDVTELGPVSLAFGTVEAYHLVPREGSARAGEFVAEVWVAPTLQYLPVRILIRQDSETWLNLLLKELPMQAAPPVSAASAASGSLRELKEMKRPGGAVSH